MATSQAEWAADAAAAQLQSQGIWSLKPPARGARSRPGPAPRGPLRDDDVDAAERLVDDAQTQGVLDAVFFHTLTSGFAAPVRAVGDVVSYAVRPISRRKRRRADDS